MDSKMEYSMNKVMVHMLKVMKDLMKVNMMDYK